MTERPPEGLPSEDGHAGWFSYEPLDNATRGDDEDPDVQVVRLRAGTHAGPFWDDEGHLSDDYEELRRWIGISRQLFDDVMAWNDDFAANPTVRRDAGWSARHLSARRALTDRLRREVRPGIEVPEPVD